MSDLPRDALFFLPRLQVFSDFQAFSSSGKGNNGRQKMNLYFIKAKKK